MRQSFKLIVSTLLVISLLLSGCGIELVRTIGRLQSSGNPVNALPSWPVDMKLGLGGTSVPLSQLLKSSKDVPLLNLPDNSYAINPASQSIPPVKIGDNLKVDAQAPIAIPPQSVTDPSVNQTGISGGPKVTLDAPMRAIDSGIPNPGAVPPGSSNFTLFDAINSSFVPATATTSKAATFSFTPAPVTQALGNGVRKATYGAGTAITLHINNDIGGADSSLVSVNLTNVAVGSVVDGLPVILNSTWRTANGGGTVPASGNIVITLDAGAKIGSFVTVSFGVSGTLGAGIRVKQLQPTQGLSATVDVKVSITAVDVAAKTLPVSSQSVNIPLPAGQGINAISNINIGTGSITVAINNGLGFNVGLQLALKGALDSNGNPFVTTVVASASTNGTGTLSLNGVTIQSTQLEVDITPSTFDSEAAPPTIPAALVLPGSLATITAGAQVSGNVTVNALQFNSANVSITRDVPIATASAPIAIPPDLAKLKVGLASISIEIDLVNQSQIPGVVSIAMAGIMPDKTQIPLQFKDPSTVFVMQAAIAANQPVTSPILITDQNSNISTILNSGASSLSFGGKVTVDTKGQLKPLTRNDQVSGLVSISIPLTLTFPALGSNGIPPFDVKPPSPLGLDATTKDYLSKGLISKFGLATVINNGFHIPLVLTLLFSKQADPYADPSALSKQLILGDGSVPQTSTILLADNELLIFRDCQTIGFRITSPGSKAPITLRSTDQLGISIVGLVKVRVSASLIQQVQGGSH